MICAHDGDDHGGARDALRHCDCDVRGDAHGTLRHCGDDGRAHAHGGHARDDRNAHDRTDNPYCDHDYLRPVSHQNQLLLFRLL